MTATEIADDCNYLIEHTDRLKIATLSKNSRITETSLNGEMRVYQLLTQYFSKVHTHVILKARDSLFVELDFLVEMPNCVLIFEVKHWYGSLTLVESDHRKVLLARINHFGEFTQEVRDNPIFTISAFRDDLRKYYKNYHGMLEATHIEKYVIFTRRDLTLNGLENITTSTRHFYVDQLEDEIKVIVSKPISEIKEWPGKYPSWDICMMTNQKLCYMLFTNRSIRINSEEINVASVDYVYLNHDNSNDSILKKRDGEYLFGLIDLNCFRNSTRRKTDIKRIIFIKFDSLSHHLL